MRLAPDAITTGDVIQEYKIIGSLKKFRYVNHQKEYIDIEEISSGDTSCISMVNRQVVNCTRIEECPPLLEQSSTFNTELVVSAKIKSPTSGWGFGIYPYMTPHTKSWFNIMVWRSRIKSPENGINNFNLEHHCLSENKLLAKNPGIPV